MTTRVRSAVGLGLASTFVLVVAACSGGGAKPSSSRLTERAMGSVAGAPQGYWEYLPPGYGDEAKRPLLIALHGSGQNGDGSKASLSRLLDNGIPKLIAADEWPAARPFIVLAPQHSVSSAGTCPDSTEIENFISFAMKRYDVDRSRVYLTGASCGAIGAWDYLALHTDEVLAGAVLIAGSGGEALASAGCNLGKVPIWAFHGADDATVDATMGTVDPMHELKTCTDPSPIDARVTVYPGVGHDSWDRTYDLSAGHDVYAWLLSHQHA